MDDDGRGAVGEGELEGHSEASRTHGQAVGAEGADIVAALGDEWHGSQAAGIVEVLVDVKGIVGLVECTAARLAAQALLSLCQQGEKVGGIAFVEGLSEFGQNDFAPFRHLGADCGGLSSFDARRFSRYNALAFVTLSTLPRAKDE